MDIHDYDRDGKTPGERLAELLEKKESTYKGREFDLGGEA